MIFLAILNELRKITRALGAQREILERIATVLEQEPPVERHIDSVQWTHNSPEAEEV